MNGMTSHNITHDIYSQNRISTALHRIVHHPHPKVDGGPPSDLGRSLSYWWVGGF